MQFLNHLEDCPIRSQLGRQGASLASGEDVDLVYTALDMGLGAGRFKALNLLHLIPKERLEIAYLERLTEGIWESYIYMNALREITRCNIPQMPKKKSMLLSAIQKLIQGGEVARLRHARKRGIRKGLEHLRKLDAARP